MGLAIVEQRQDLLHRLVETWFGHHPLRTVAETDIALAAVVVVLFAKVAKQLTAAADVVVGGIANHGMDTVGILCLTLLVDDGHELDMLLVLASLGITDVRCLLLWDEVEDMALAEALEDHVNLLGLQAALLGDEGLVDIIIIGEESAVVAQQGRDDTLFVVGVVLQSVEFVTTDGEHDACLIILLLGIFDVARTVEDLQGRVDLDGEMMEGVTELVDVELEGVVIA